MIEEQRGPEKTCIWWQAILKKGAVGLGSCNFGHSQEGHASLRILFLYSRISHQSGPQNQKNIYLIEDFRGRNRHVALEKVIWETEAIRVWPSSFEIPKSHRTKWVLFGQSRSSDLERAARPERKEYWMRTASSNRHTSFAPMVWERETEETCP